MTALTTQIEINAPPDKVWTVLTDFPAYPKWNPFIREIEGSPAVGERLRVRIQPEGSKGMTFQPKVLMATPNQELRWIGHLFFPGLFDGEHVFRIEAIGTDRVCFIQEEKFRGILVGLFAQSLEQGTKPGFEAMNRALKTRVEQDAP